MNIRRFLVGLVVASFLMVATVAHAGWSVDATCSNEKGHTIKIKVKDGTANTVWGTRNSTTGTWLEKNVDLFTAFSVMEAQCIEGQFTTSLEGLKSKLGL